MEAVLKRRRTAFSKNLSSTKFDFFQGSNSFIVLIAFLGG